MEALHPEARKEAYMDSASMNAARQAKLSPERRQAIARQAALARWADRPHHTHTTPYTPADAFETIEAALIYAGRTDSYTMKLLASLKALLGIA
jgi:hypothetical protein